MHRRWLADLRFEQATHHVVLEDMIATLEAATARRDRLTQEIEARLDDWSLAPVVRTVQALRGMALVNAATVVAELGDLTRFANPRQLMTYLGLVPSEHSSGARRSQGGITKPATLRRAACWWGRPGAIVFRLWPVVRCRSGRKVYPCRSANRLEATTQALPPLPPAGSLWQTRDRRKHGDCPRARWIRLGDRSTDEGQVIEIHDKARTGAPMIH